MSTIAVDWGAVPRGTRRGSLAHVAGTLALAVVVPIGGGLLGCGGSGVGGGGDAAAPDASWGDAALAPDAAGWGDAGAPDAGGEPIRIWCELVHMTPIHEGGQDTMRIRVLMSEPSGGGELTVTEMDELQGGVLLRTVPLARTSTAGDWVDPVFGYDGPVLSEEAGLCQDLPPLEPFHFVLRGTVDGAPAEGDCGFGPGTGGWPPEVRVACGDLPFLDGAIDDVYVDLYAPPPGMTDISMSVRLRGPATGVTLTPETLVGALDGMTETRTIGPSLDFEVYDVRADDPSTGDAFDGTVPAEGRTVFLSLWGEGTLGPGFCMDTGDPGLDPTPILYIQGSGTSSQGAFGFTTAGYSCVTEGPDMDHVLP